MQTDCSCFGEGAFVVWRGGHSVWARCEAGGAHGRLALRQATWLSSELLLSRRGRSAGFAQRAHYWGFGRSRRTLKQLAPRSPAGWRRRPPRTARRSLQQFRVASGSTAERSARAGLGQVRPRRAAGSAALLAADSSSLCARGQRRCVPVKPPRAAQWEPWRVGSALVPMFSGGV